MVLHKQRNDKISGHFVWGENQFIDQIIYTINKLCDKYKYFVLYILKYKRFFNNYRFL